MTIGFISIVCTLIFFLLHYVSVLTTPTTLIHQKILKAFQDENLAVDKYPHAAHGATSIHTLKGLDQYSECVLILLSLYQGASDFETAVIPKVALTDLVDKTPCEHAQLIASGVPISEDASYYYLRYWYGAKVVLAILLKYLNFFQINNLLKAFAYFSYALLGILLLQLNKKYLFFLPIIFFGTLFSGINYIGGVLISMPYLTSLFLINGLLLLKLFSKQEPHFIYFFTISGHIFAFFFDMTGALMLSISMFFLILYFIMLKHKSEFEKYRTIVIYISIFLFGVISSLFLKALVSFLLLGWKETIGKLLSMSLYHLETSKVHGDVIYGSVLLEILNRQLGGYSWATYGSSELAKLLQVTSLFALGSALLVNVYLFYKKKDLEAFYSFGAIVLASLIVFARYFIFRSHSGGHLIFISRYLFLPLSFGWVALIISMKQATDSNFWNQPHSFKLIPLSVFVLFLMIFLLGVFF